MNNEDIEILERSYNFALRIFKVCKSLEDNRTTRILGVQLLRSGTSIRANVEEASAAQSKKDFISKMSIALKEARETNYWLRILRDTETLKPDRLHEIIAESESISKIIAKIIISTKRNLEKSNL